MLVVDVGDVELVAGWRAGEVSCAALLFGRHRAGMHAVAVSMLGPGADAEDAVQEAVLLALSRITALRDPSAAGAWLRGITRNVCRQWIDRHRSEAVLPDVETDGGVGPEAAIDALATRDWVWTALEALTPPLRYAVVLRYFSAAHTYEAIAAALGVPVGTVRSRLSEARRILTASLHALADVTHGDHAQVQQGRTALFATIYDEYNRGQDCVTLRAALLADAELRAGAAAAGPLRGRDRIVRDIESDVEAGVRLTILDVIAGPDITVVEGVFDNPIDDPDHCPAVTTQRCSYTAAHRSPRLACTTALMPPRPVSSPPGADPIFRTLPAGGRLVGMTDHTTDLLVRLDDVPVPTYVSEGDQARGREVAGRTGRVLDWLSALFGTRRSTTLYVVGPNEWDEVAAIPLYGMPHAVTDRVVTSSTPAPFWSEYTDRIESTLPVADAARLYKVYGDPPDLGGRFADLVIAHELTHLYHEFDEGTGETDFPRLWLAELFANIGLYGYIAEHEPEQLAVLETICELSALAGPEIWSVRELNRMEEGLAAGPHNYIWFEFLLILIAKRIWCHGATDGFITFRDRLRAPALTDGEILDRLNEVAPEAAVAVQKWPD